MFDLRSILLAGLFAVLPLMGANAASPSLGPLNTQSTICDYRGCFGFGPQQWHRPAYVQPNYLPPNAAGPNYYQPPGQLPPRLTYGPPPAPRVQPSADNQVRHQQWCRNEYRSYNPRTDRFLTYEGIYRTCNSPYN